MTTQGAGTPADDTARPARRGGASTLAVLLGLAVPLVVVTVLVALGVTSTLDADLVGRLRPGRVWGPTQRQLAPVMTWLGPARMYALLLATSSLLALRRRSWSPAAFGALLALGSATATLGLKLLLSRPGPAGELPGTGGAYPSGHIIAVLVCTTGCAMLLRPRVPLFLWTPVLAAVGLMATSLLLTTAHWPTDVVGGVLTGLLVLAVASRSRLRQAAARSRPPA